MSSRRAGFLPSRTGGQVDVHGDVLVAPLGVAPDVLIDAQSLDPREAVRILGDGLLGAGQWSGWFSRTVGTRCSGGGIGWDYVESEVLG